MVKELNLSPEQVEQFKQLRKDNDPKGKREANQKQMMELRKKIVDEYALESFDKAKIETYKKQILDLYNSYQNENLGNLKINSKA
jgi:Spy/CpxP family protein refolding chaperone